MRISIRTKLLIYMLVSVLFFVVLLLIANTFLVEWYYLKRTKSELIRTSQEMERLVSDGVYDAGKGAFELPGAKVEALGRLERTRGHSVTLRGVDDTVFYPIPMSDLASAVITVQTTEREQIDDGGSISIVESTTEEEYTEEADSEEQPLIVQVNTDNLFLTLQPELVIETETDGSMFILEDDTELKVRTLRYRTVLPNGLTVNVSAPMSVVSDGIAISNRFSTIIGLITVVFTVIWATVISHYFTKPIQEMSQITSKMKMLDFSEKIECRRRNDEISQLSDNINQLSDKLNDTIQELNVKNLRLEEEVDRERKIDKMRRDFIANVSHELKTPIFLIQGYADGLKQNIISSEKKKEFYCDVIAEEAEKMNGIVRDLLMIAKSESAHPSITKEVFVIEDLIQSVLDKYKMSLQERRIRLSWNPVQQTTVYGDPRKIEQVVTNYLNNAIEFAGGEREIAVSIHMEPETVRVSVYNSGEPISAEMQELIWTSFYKADESRNRMIGGAGLGLAIVRSIMEAHHNRYGVYNSKDGVTFWFELDPTKDCS